MFSQCLDGTLLCRSTYEDRAVPMTHRQHALHFERHQRLTERRATDTEFGRQITLCRQAITGRHFVVGDVPAQLLDDDFVEPRPSDGPKLLNH
jgi:hypothetical protein